MRDSAPYCGGNFTLREREREREIWGGISKHVLALGDSNTYDLSAIIISTILKSRIGKSEHGFSIFEHFGINIIYSFSS